MTGRATARWQQIVVYIYAALTLGLLTWAAIVVAGGPCRGQGSPAPCRASLADAVPLAVSVVLWVVAVVSVATGSPNPPLAFFLFAGVLAAGIVSATGSDLATRLYVLLLAWAPPALYLLQVRLLGQPSGIHIFVTNVVLFSLAVLISVPAVVARGVPLAAARWYPLWEALMRLGLILGVAASLALLMWASRGGCEAATRRPIRVATFGLVSAALPMALLSALPDLVGLPVRVPYGITMLGLTLLPVMYAHALVLSPDGRAAGFLRQVLVYYLLLVTQAAAFLAGTALVEGISGIAAHDLPVVNILLGVILVALLAPVRQALERLTHWVWFGRASPYALVVGRLAEGLSVALDQRSLVRLVVHEVMQAYGLTAIALYLRSHSGGSAGTLALTAQVGMSYLTRMGPLPLTGALALELLALNEPAFPDALRKAVAGGSLSPNEEALLSLAGVSLWIPLASGGRLYGLLLAGQKVDEDWFSAEDLRTLSTIAHQSGMAAHNVLLIEELRDSRRDLERAHQQLLTAGEQEQRRLAQELHDGAVQQLLSVRYQLAEVSSALEAADGDGHPDHSPASALASLREELSAVVEQLREHIGALRPAGLDDLGLAAALVGLAHRLEREHAQTMPRLVLELDDRALNLPPEYEINLYRVAQEALRNALAHAGASEIILRLLRGPDDLVLSVRDDGCGFAVPARLGELAADNHFGLVSMSERMGMLSGSLEVLSAPGRGTEIIARLEHRWEANLAQG